MKILLTKYVHGAHNVDQKRYVPAVTGVWWPLASEIKPIDFTSSELYNTEVKLSASIGIKDGKGVPPSKKIGKNNFLAIITYNYYK